MSTGKIKNRGAGFNYGLIIGRDRCWYQRCLIIQPNRRYSTYDSQGSGTAKLTLMHFYVPQWVKFQLNALSLKRKQQKEVPIWPQIMPEKANDGWQYR